MPRILRTLALLVLAALLAMLIGCSGGGPGSSGNDGSDVGNPDPGADATAPQLVAVMDDVNADGELDMMMVSTETDPILVTRVLLGDGNGRFVDDAASIAEDPLGPEASEAILARLRGGTPDPEGIELLHIVTGGAPRTLYLIFA
jgi:hypothetical protein